MNKLQIFVILVIVFFIQLTVLNLISIFNTTPDLIVCFVIFFALFFGARAGFEAGFFLGILKDIYSTDISGANTISLVLTGLIVGIFSHKLFKESGIIQVFTVFIFTLFYFFIHYFWVSAISKITYISLSEYLIYSFIPVSLYTALISAVIFPFLINRYGLKENREYL